MKFTTRKLKLPGDYPQLARIWNFIFSEPVSADEVEANDLKIPQGSLSRNEDGQLTGHDRNRIVAVNANDELVGYGVSWRAPWTAAGHLDHYLIVDPQYRKQGIGSRLYQELESWALELGASQLNYEVRDNDEDAVRFAKHRGFEVQRHTFESVLDLASFDGSSFEQRMAEFERSGLRIVRYSELPGPENERKLYELYRDTAYDIPGFTGDYYDSAEWRKWTLELAGAKPENILVTADGSEFVGVAQLLHFEATNSMYHEYTGVRKEHRNRGIGLTLKFRSIELAIRAGMKYMRTNNDSLNGTMLRINRDKMGFVPVPGKYVMVKKP